MKSTSLKLLFKTAILLALCTQIHAQALSIHGQPLFNGESVAYVNKNAPQGGKLIFGVHGTFDTLNPLNIKGLPSPEIRHYTIEALMKRHMNEPFALYPSLATATRDKGKITYKLHEKARFSNGDDVTTRDVAFSWELLKSQGRPTFRTYYNKITKLEMHDAKNFTFHYDDDDQELPLILSLMSVISHKNDTAKFSETTLTPLIASGAYVITEAKAGEKVVMEKLPSWWGQDLPINKEQYNFQTIQFDFYRDSQALYEAFTKGLIDWRLERDPAKWSELQALAKSKDLPMRFHAISSKMPKPYRAYFMNIRKGPLAQKPLREAIIAAFDGEFINNQFYQGQYERITSLFSGSELTDFTPPAPLEKRLQLRQSLKALTDNGFTIKDGVLWQDNKPVELELIVNSRDQERLAKVTASQVKALGIALNIRLLDAAQYEFRLNHFDYDLVEHTLTNSLSPGHEQAIYWGTLAAQQAGSRNYAGVSSQAIDALIINLTKAMTREEVVKNAKSLDKLITQEAVTLPLFQPKAQWIALHKRIEMPHNQSIYGYLPETWFKGAQK